MAMYQPLKTTNIKLMVSNYRIIKVLWGQECVYIMELYDVIVRDDIKYLSLDQC